MIVLHAALGSTELTLWTEATFDASRRRSAKPTAPPRSPYDGGASALMIALAAASLVEPVEVDEGCVEESVLWVPAVDGVPAPSTPILGAPPGTSPTEEEAGSRLAPFLVRTLSLSWMESIDLLASCSGRDLLAPGILVGRDIAFWGHALAFAGSLVARQQFLPSLVEQGGWPVARFRPSIAGSDLRTLQLLAEAMPDAARALGATPAPPNTPATIVLHRFLDATIDGIVRDAHAGTPGTLAGWRAGRSLHDRWLQALADPDGILDATPDEVADLERHVASWQRPAILLASSPSRLGFRLEDPPTPKEPWHVRYLVQSVNDPSLIVAVEQAPAHSPADMEYLLMALGQAARIDPNVHERLADPKLDWSGHDLDATGAYQFLTETAPALEQAGFAIWLPAWWTGKATKKRLSARARIESPLGAIPGSVSLKDSLKLRWELALGGEPITMEELERLAELKAPLVHVRGQWVQMRAEEIEAAVALARKRGKGQVTLAEAVRMSLGASPAAGVAFDGVDATGWMASFLDQLHGSTPYEELKPPKSFQGELRPYQVRGYSWLAFLERFGLGACLADDMGLGKTIQALALVERAWEQGERRPTLLVCPTSVVSNWEREAARFTPEIPVLIHHGHKRERSSAFAELCSAKALCVTSYSLLSRDAELFRGVPWRTLILDEAQNVKNAATQLSKSARSIPADHRIALTGTPVENNVGDLWAIMEVLNPGLLGGADAFRRNFLIPIQAQRSAEAMERLKLMTGPFILRRLKTDKTIIDDLPEKLEMKVYCTLTKEQASLYQAIAGGALEAISQSEGMGRRAAILATLTKLKQACNHPAQLLGDNSVIPGRSGKLARLTEMLAEVREEGDRALVFTQYAEMGSILKRHLEECFGVEVPYLYGGVARKAREGLVARFQSDDGPPFFVLSLKAGGTGLNLTAANHVFHFDRWWNPAVETQATDRAFRIGQTQQVQVRKLICAGTVEDKIDAMIESKKEISEKVVGSGESFLTELSTNDLGHLFQLDATGRDE